METVIPRNNIKPIKRFQFSRCEIIHFHLSSSIFTFNFHFQGITFCCCTNDNETWPKNPPTRPIFELLYNRFYGISAQTSSVPPTAKPWRVDESVVVEKKKKKNASPIDVRSVPSRKVELIRGSRPWKSQLHTPERLFAGRGTKRDPGKSWQKGSRQGFAEQGEQR